MTSEFFVVELEIGGFLIFDFTTSVGLMTTDPLRATRVGHDLFSLYPEIKQRHTQAKIVKIVAMYDVIDINFQPDT